MLINSGSGALGMADEKWVVLHLPFIQHRRMGSANLAWVWVVEVVCLRYINCTKQTMSQMISPRGYDLF